MARGPNAGTFLIALLGAGLAVRLFIAAVYLPQSGFAIDIGDFTAWAQRLASVGPAGFYAEGYFSDYPPGYLYVLWLLGAIGAAMAPLAGGDVTAALVKVPGILADVGGAGALFAICRRWGPELIGSVFGAAGSPRAVERLGLTAVTVYLFNPGAIFDSAVWGQIDSVGTLVVLLTIYVLGRGWTEAAAAGAVLAMLVKFQFAFLVPIVIIVGIKRHLFGRSADDAHDGRRQPVRVLSSLAIGVGALVLLMLPFGMTIYAPRAGGAEGAILGLLPEADPQGSLVGKLIEAANTYTGLTINAFNLWRNPWSGLGDTLFWGDDSTAVLAVGTAVLTWQQVGAVLFAIVALFALYQVARRDDLRGMLLGSLLLAIAFFVLPTRVHERYLFPALALAAPLVLTSRAWPWIYGGLSLSFFANIYWTYTEDWSFAGRVLNPGVGGSPMPQDPVLGATLLTDWGIWLVSAMAVALLLTVAWHSMRLASTRPAIQWQATDSSPPAPEPVSRPDRRARTGQARSTSGMGWLRPNPADVYLAEPARRLDRRDALLLLGVVAFALVFRLWRLDVPRGQHFDEVYHARSAAEFLSDWRNGWHRDVYEWTHPMLAKYLIAGGIVLADPNRVVGGSGLDAAAPAVTVAPARSSVGQERSVAFTAGNGSSVAASDAESGEQVASWQAGGPVASLAYDADGRRLLVGRADSGTIEVYAVADLLGSRDGRAPPAEAPLSVGLEAVSQIQLPADADQILVRGPDGVALLDEAGGAPATVAEGAFGGAAYVSGADGEAGAVAVTDPSRNSVLFLDEAGSELDVIAVDAPLVGPLVARGSGDDQQLFALTGPLAANDEHGATRGGIGAIDADARSLIDVVPLPGAPAHIGHQVVADVLYVAGTSTEGTPTLWTVEPHVEDRGDTSSGLATFDATALPGTALAMAFDVSADTQADDRGRLLISTAGDDGSAALVQVDAGSNAFAWRLAGVLFGALLVALVYLLAATLFGRRRIALLAAGFVAIDGMSYVMSRIAMNDIFVTVFILAAYLLFWQVWSGRWARSAWWVLPSVGVLVGLAAATKWVGFYAMAGLLVLALARSDLGRMLLVALVALVTVVGGIGAPWPFAVAMLLALGIALAVVYARPVRLEPRETLVSLLATAAVLAGVGLAFVIAYGQVAGRTPTSAVEYLFSILARGAQAGWPAWIMLGVAGALIAWRAWLSLRDPHSDSRWYRPGEMGGFAWSWVGACLVVIPLTVYGLSYLPYVELGHAFAATGESGPGYGWSVEELHSQMFSYHFNLTASHASSSPWWSWPLALKPTWFFSGNYDFEQVAVIYNGSNPILAWAGIPALVACAVLAWRRRSAALALIVAAFAFQLVPWIRIERATFAYHYLTAAIFAMVAVAYMVDELLRRPAWRELAVGYLGLVVLIGILIYPLGSALPMPDWYINAARTLPPWNYAFQFPDPPQGERGELVTLDGLKLLAGGLLALVAVAWAFIGRDILERVRAHPRRALSDADC